MTEKLMFGGVELIPDNPHVPQYYAVVCKECGTVSSCQPDGHGMHRYCARCGRDRDHGYVLIRENKP